MHLCPFSKLMKSSGIQNETIQWSEYTTTKTVNQAHSWYDTMRYDTVFYSVRMVLGGKETRNWHWMHNVCTTYTHAFDSFAHSHTLIHLAHSSSAHTIQTGTMNDKIQYKLDRTHSWCVESVHATHRKKVEQKKFKRINEEERQKCIRSGSANTQCDWKQLS